MFPNRKIKQLIKLEESRSTGSRSYRVLKNALKVYDNLEWDKIKDNYLKK